MSDFTLISGSGVTKEDIRKALLLDRMVYSEKYWLSLDTCLSYFRKNPDIYIMVKCGEEVVAYICVLPVTKECYEKIKGGEFLDASITSNMVTKFENMCDLYFSSIVIHPKFRSLTVLRRLLSAFIEKLKNLAGEGVFIRRMIADAVSTEGRKTCKLFGMEEISHKHLSNPFEVSFLPPKFRAFSKSVQELFEIYSTEYARLQTEGDAF